MWPSHNTSPLPVCSPVSRFSHGSGGEWVRGRTECVSRNEHFPSTPFPHLPPLYISILGFLQHISLIGNVFSLLEAHIGLLLRCCLGYLSPTLCFCAVGTVACQLLKQSLSKVKQCKVIIAKPTSSYISKNMWVVLFVQNSQTQCSASVVA